MGEPIRVLIADDHPIVRSGLASLITIQPDMQLVAEAADGEEAVTKARSRHPDVVVLDLLMPHKDGIQATQEILQDHPETGILILTNYAEDEHIFPVMQAGALGYQLKDCPPSELLAAIRAVAQGRSALDHRVALRLMHQFQAPADTPPATEVLTERELEVLRWLAQGLSNEAIGEWLMISERTVGSHVSHILRKLNLENRTQAALYAIRNGLVNLDADET